MKKTWELYQRNETIKKILVIIVSSFASAVSLNMFLTPANVFSTGINGVSQLLSSGIESTFHIKIDIGIFILLLNIPIAVLGWIKLGKNATIWSIINVICISIVTMFVPVHEISSNPLMNAIIGGVLVGIAVGFSLKYGFTTGGTDIISLVLAKTTGKSVGNLLFSLNLLIIVIAGFGFNWESALYTIISIYCMTQVIDAIHTSHQKITALIVTHNPEPVINAIQTKLVRGMTLIPAKGGYSRNEGQMIMIVITRYELYELEQVVYEQDQNAFINIMPTQTVLGKFWNEDEQRVMKVANRDND